MVVVDIGFCWLYEEVALRSVVANTRAAVKTKISLKKAHKASNERRRKLLRFGSSPCSGANSYSVC